MEGLENETLTLIEQQMVRKNEVEDIMEKHRAVGVPVLTRLQRKAKIESLEKILEQYQIAHEEILKKGKIDIPYIANKTGENMIAKINQFIVEVKNTQSLDTQTTSRGSQKENADLVRKMKLLRIKVSKLKLAIEDIHADFKNGTQWTKDLFDVKQKFLHTMWQSISALEEEIELEYDDSTFDTNISHDALHDMNDVIKKMATFISSNSHSSRKEEPSSEESRLPRIKLPVFKGDIKQWSGFKEIFEALVHSKTNVSRIEKMEYLKSHLEGEPASIISSYSLSGVNYEDAWAALNNRYNNKRRLLDFHLDRMTKPLGKEVTSKVIKEMYDNINEGMNAIKNMGIDNSTWGPLIVHMVIKLLDRENRGLFEEKFNADPNEIPDFKMFMGFLESRFKSLEMMESIKQNSKAKTFQQEESKIFHSKSIPRGLCPKCKEEHRLAICPKFLSIKEKARFSFIKAQKLCFKCLEKHSREDDCPFEVKPCKECQSKRHNVLIHLPRFNVITTSQATIAQEEQDIDVEKTLAAISCNEENQEVLATAVVRVKNVFGDYVPVRVLVDSGAQKNYITEGLAQKLQIRRQECRTNVTGIGKTQAFKVKSAVNVTIEPHFDSEFERDIKALVMGKRLTSKVPDQKIDEQLPKSWQSLKLADPLFGIPGEIDMVVGIGFFVSIILPGIKKSTNSNMVALNSKIGWIIFGEFKSKPSSDYRNVQSMVSLIDVQNDISQFWELEEITTEKTLSEEDNFCEQHYSTTHRRQPDGRYIVKIPFNEELKLTTVLGMSRKRALCCFYNLESTFRRNPEMAVLYKKFIKEYISLGHMKKVFDNQEDNDVYFMPHHVVERPDKIRVVFNASSKTENNLSLNEVMYAGPRLQDDITCIILRWRMFKYVVIADIEKMYRQILVSPEHRKYQRIFWRDSPDEKLSVYELSTVTYGTTAAPFLAIRTLQQLAKDDFQLYPDAAKSVLEDFYVDDLLTGRDTIEQCAQLQKDVQALLKGGGMLLRKWSSNNQAILEGLPKEVISEQMFNLGNGEQNSMKALGLYWSPTNDEFMFQCNNRPLRNIIIEGNIGCGKSTLLDFLKIKDNIEVFSEPVEKWTNCAGINLLEKFYECPSEWAFRFQDYVINTIVENHIQSSTADIKVMERSIFAVKHVFLRSLRNAANISDAEFKTLDKKCSKLIKSHDISADLIVYLRTDPEVAHCRIKSRGRSEECNITLEEIEELHNIYEDYMANTQIPVMAVDANQSSKIVLRNVLSAIHQEISSPTVTKRMLCSDISRIFDPLGWLAPITIVGKMIFQQTWEGKIDWNDKLPVNIQKLWLEFKRNLDAISEIRIPRWINTTSSSYLELYGFCDASEKAYAAAMYVKVTPLEGEASVHLLMAKTKVAPIKQQLTIAKLELCGALLLSKLYQFIVSTFKWIDKKFTAWCDSQIALSWIKGEPSRWKVFVANRISQIQQLTRKTDWRYIPTKENCADIATRGSTSAELQKNALWWFGPEWLRFHEDNWPTFNSQVAPDVPELRKKNVLALASPSSDTIENIIERFSSLYKIKTVIAYCLRFCNNCRSTTKETGPLTADEFQEAERCLIKQVQVLHYKEDIDNIQQRRKLNNHNGILALSPMLDCYGILRIVGRLQNSYLSFDEKHPIILPRDSPLSKLVVRDAHIKCFHGADSLTEYTMRRRFWIVKGRTLIKSAIFHCVICKRRSAQLLSQQMGQLPEVRVKLHHAFYSTGVDYAGPFEIKAWKGRCNKKYKSYVSLFVCMVTKALHLELVTDLSSEGFLAAYRRFSARRGPCMHMYSDCGTNFVGANNILKTQLEEFQERWKEEMKPLTVEGLQWHFNPPSAPHAGGIWEAAVKSMKKLLIKYLTHTTLTYEEFSTVLTQVEGCLNSRPLGVLRNVPEDRAILTPSHFLIGTSMFTNPELEVGNASLADRWTYI